MNDFQRTRKTSSLAVVAAIFLVVLLAIAAFFFWGFCRQQPGIVPASAPPPDAAPAPKRLAPLGLRYLTKRATITSAAGVTGIPVGAEVKVVGPENGVNITVEYKGNKLLLPASQLTRDLDLVDSLTKPAAASATSALPTSPQQQISPPGPPVSEQESPSPPPAPQSFFEKITGPISLWWQNLCDWFNPPPPTPPPTPAMRVEQQHQQQQQQQEQKKIEHTSIFNQSKRQWIAFHEQALRDLEKKLIGRRDASGIMAIQKQIAEKRILITGVRLTD